MKRGFTLIELLVVIAIIAILAAMIFPALSRAKQRAQGALCLNNGKQLMMAIHMYAGDNNEFFPPNPDDGNTMTGYNWCPGLAGIGQINEFNPDVLLDPDKSLLVRYLSGNASVFKCPADKREGKYQGTNSLWAGKQVPAARTFSMSQAVGTIDPGFDQGGRGQHSGRPELSVNGPWLDGTHNHIRNSPYRTFGKMTDTGAPGPSMLWVLVDEDAMGLNDAAFAVDMEDVQWNDLPGTYHNRGCGFAFADGHSETHQWIFKSQKEGGQIFDEADEKDWEWMTAHTSAKVK
jgi:prepilin-type N-terminal cleavage/methylation domain-containing protein/prepilin-type processing-associated H-X9-DG protein